MGVNLSRMQVHVVMIVLTRHVINQMINYGSKLYAVLIFLQIGFPQIFNRRCTAINLILTKNNSVGGTTGISTLHLRLKTTKVASRGAM